MSNQQSQNINDQNTGSEFSRHWLLVLVCAAGIGVGVSALPFYTQGIFIEAWIADFGWTRAQASLGILGSTLALAAALPFVGLIVDRYGLVTRQRNPRSNGSNRMPKDIRHQSGYPK